MRHLILVLCLLFLAGSAFGQATIVTLQATDAGGQSWNNGSYQFSLVPNPQYPNLNSYTWTGGALSLSISGSLNSSGGATPSIPSNTAISPGGSRWVIQVCPQATAACFNSAATTIQNPTQTVTLTPPAIAINLSNPPGAFTSAYTDAEIASAPLGGQYFNLTSLVTKTCIAVTGSACTSWATGGGGGSGVTSFNTRTGAVTTVSGDIPNNAANTSGTAANLSGTPALPNGTTATTQTAADNSTKLATTAYADTAGAGSTSGGASNAWYLSTVACGSNTHCTKINADVAFVNNASAINTSSTITCPSNDCNFIAADVGKTVWATTVPAVNGTSTLVCGQSTIQSVNSAQSITVAAANDCTSTATVVLYWGTKDGAAIASAATSVGCGTLQFPGFSSRKTGLAAYILVDQPFGNSTATPQQGCGAGNPALGVINGAGQGATTLILTPDFNWAGCTGTGATFGVCFGSAFQQVNYMVFSGGGLTGATACPAAAQNKVLLATHTQAGQKFNTNLQGICPGTTGLEGIELNSLDDVSTWGGGQAVGQYACVANAVATSMFYNDCDNTSTGGTGLWVKAGAQMQDFGSFHIVNALVNGILNTHGTHFDGTGSNYAVNCTGAGSQWLGDGDFINQAPNPGGNGLSTASGCKAQARRTAFAGPGGNVAISNSGSFISEGGNSVTANIVGGTGPWSGLDVLKGACSGTATSSATLGLYGLGQSTTLTCTSTTVNLGVPMGTNGTLLAMEVTATHAGVNASSGVVTLLKNNVATTITCTIGTGTSCFDTNHTVAYVVGDIISIQFTTQGSEVLAGVAATVLAW